MDAEKVIKAAAALQDVSISEVAERLGTSQQNFAKRLKHGKFSIDEWERIAAALGLKFSLSFTNPEENTVVSSNGIFHN